MQIAKSNDDADGIVDGGQTLTYSITLTNAGTIPQTGVTVDDVLPAGVTYVPGSTVATQGTTVRDNAPEGPTPTSSAAIPSPGRSSDRRIRSRSLRANRSWSPTR